MIVEQAVAIEREGLSLLEISEGLEKCLEVRWLKKHVLPMVTSVDDVVDPTIFDRSQRARHLARIADGAWSVIKIVLTPLLLPLLDRSSYVPFSYSVGAVEVTGSPGPARWC